MATRILCSAALLLAWAATAAAHDGGRFGDGGTLAPLGRIAAAWSHVQPPSGDAAWMVDVDASPGLYWFADRNVAVGVLAHLGFASTLVAGERVRSTSWGGGLRGGYNVALGKEASFFPSVGVGWAQASAGPPRDDENRVTGRRLFFDVDAPLLVHLGNFFLGGGPFFRLDAFTSARVGAGDWEAADRDSTVGVHTVLGGWW